VEDLLGGVAMSNFVKHVLMRKDLVMHAVPFFATLTYLTYVCGPGAAVSVKSAMPGEFCNQGEL
jgi:hypothetical protein